MEDEQSAALAQITQDLPKSEDQTHEHQTQI